MARNVNVDSMTFDGQLMREPMSYRFFADGQLIEDDAGIDTFITSNQHTRARIEVHCAFKDWDDAKTLLTTKYRGEGTLTLVTHEIATTTDKTLTILNMRLKSVTVEAVHNDPGTHVAVFVARSADGSTNPAS